MTNPTKTISLTLTSLLFLHLTLDYAYASGSSMEDAISRTVKSMEGSLPGDVETIAIWKVDNKTPVDIYAFELLDNLELSLIHSPRFKVIDRTQLSQILSEQKFSLTGLVDPERRKKVGELTGVDAFLYGEITDTSKAHEGIDEVDYYTTLNLRLLDVKTGTLIWEREIQGHNEESIKELLGGMPTAYSRSKIEDVAEKTASLLEDKLGSRSGIATLAIWKIDDDTGSVNIGELYNKLSLRLSKSTKFRVVDRSNIDLLLQEQKLSVEGVVDPDEQGKIGKLWGIDGFIFGRIPRGGVTSDSIEMSLRAIDVGSGMLVWGDRVTGSERSVALPAIEYREHITSLPDKPKRQKVDSIPGKAKKPEFEEEKRFTWVSSMGSGMAYFLSALLGVVGLSTLGSSPEAGLSMIVAAAVGFGAGVALDYIFSPSTPTKPIPENIEYNRQLEAEILGRNREIEEYNAGIDAEIERRNMEIDESNRRIESTKKANTLLKYLRPGE